jgi:aminoglycoside 3-N-acetyltransferase
MLLKKKDIFNYFKKSNIKKKDIIFLHGNSMAFFQIEGKDSLSKTKKFWNLLIEFLGKDGTIIVPSFTYSIGKNKIFNIKNSKSKIGQFSEDFRKYFSQCRTSDPIFSVCANGKNKKKIKKLKYTNSFGKSSIFDFLYKYNVKIICLGCELEVVTFLHYIEQVLNVPYRGYKEFDTYSAYKNKKLKKQKIKFFCRLDGSKFKYNLNHLKKEMIKKNKLTRSRLGRVKSYSFKSKDFFNLTINILKKNNKALINEI